MEKNLLIKITENSTDKEKQLYELVSEFNSVENKLKAYEKQKDMLKEELKKYDFEKVTFTLEKDKILTLEVKQWESVRKQFKEESLVALLKPKIPEIEKLIENCKEEKIVKSIKFTVKEA